MFQDILDAVTNAFTNFWNWIVEGIAAFGLWLLELLLALIGVVLDAFVFLLNLIPFPVSASDLAGASIPSGVAYFLDAAALDFGIVAIVGAYIARFIIRRLPVVG